MVYCIRTLYTTLYTTLQVVLSLRHLYYDTTKTIVREKGNIFVRHVLRFCNLQRHGLRYKQNISAI